MVHATLVKILLSPLALLYGLGVSLRNVFYRTGLLRSVSFNIPVISVGNLSVGGAGKTPHIEYIIRLLKDYINVATLSRGYGRKTQGFLVVESHMNAEQAGDEPLQFKRKYPEILAGVAESRALAIPRLLMEDPETQVVLLDDAFQHRAVQPGLNILLTEYDNLFTRDFLLPSGRLREWRSAYRRADVLVVTKCPPVMESAQKEALIRELKPLPHQKIYFSYYEYGTPYYIFNPRFQATLQEDRDVLLVSGIARTEYLKTYISEKSRAVFTLAYEDHHFFDDSDLSDIKKAFGNITTEGIQKMILTTEKDAVRLEMHKSFIIENKLPVFVMPVQVQFHFDEKAQFDQTIRDFLLNFKV
ncbi:MAG: tetraacyldisaccharide 4'-kinase [Saprospiraceae bacterium]|nr:tetraacyldisaccharide 4'-kinase [Saprospiraceae bacterium]